MNPNDLNLVAEVSLKEPRLFVSHAPPRQGKDGKRMRILAIDCGIKANIIRYFMSKGVELLVVPWDYDFSGEAVDAPLPLRRHAAGGGGVTPDAVSRRSTVSSSLTVPETPPSAKRRSATCAL